MCCSSLAPPTNLRLRPCHNFPEIRMLPHPVHGITAPCSPRPIMPGLTTSRFPYPPCLLKGLSTPNESLLTLNLSHPPQTTPSPDRPHPFLSRSAHFRQAARLENGDPYHLCKCPLSIQVISSNRPRLLSQAPPRHLPPAVKGAGPRAPRLNRCWPIGALRVRVEAPLDADGAL